MSLTFDIRTAYLITALTSLICAAMLFASRRLHRPSQSGVAWSSSGLALIGLATMGFALRGAVPDVVSYQAANVAGPLGVAMLYESTRRLCMARPMPWLVGAIAAGLVACHLWLGDAPEVHAERLVVTSIVQGACAAMMLPLLIRRIGKDPAIPVNAAIALALIGVTIHTVRSIVVLRSGVATVPGGTFVTGALQGSVAGLFALLPMLQAMTVLGWVNARIARELRQLATIDELTGLSTRRHFFAQARSRLDARPADDGSIGLLMLDLDGFKQINDRFGHGVGDRALAHFGETLRRGLSPADLAGRYGGEEFCALVRRDSEDEIGACAEAIRWAVADNPLLADGQAIPMTVSIGLSSTREAASLEDLLVIADRRVNLAKSMGRDQIVDRRTVQPRTARPSADPVRIEPATVSATTRDRAASAA